GARLRVVRSRGVFHAFNIRPGGLIVYPRLVAAEHRHVSELLALSSGIPAVDELLGGAIHRGTSTLMIGPAGAGKSALATHYAVSAAQRGEHVATFIFDESLSTLYARSGSRDLDLRKHVDSGRISIQQIDPAEVPPGEFVHLVREAVE